MKKVRPPSIFATFANLRMLEQSPYFIQEDLSVFEILHQYSIVQIAIVNNRRRIFLIHVIQFEKPCRLYKP